MNRTQVRGLALPTSWESVLSLRIRGNQLFLPTEPSRLFCVQNGGRESYKFATVPDGKLHQESKFATIPHGKIQTKSSKTLCSHLSYTRRLLTQKYLVLIVLKIIVKPLQI